MARPDGAAPRAPMDDSVSGVVAVELRYIDRANEAMRRDLQRHFDDDIALQKTLWERLHKLENLKWWVTGATAVICVVLGLVYSLGSRYLQLEVSAVVLTQVREQTAQSLDDVGAKIEATNALLRRQADEDKRHTEEQIKRIETALRKR